MAVARVPRPCDQGSWPNPPCRRPAPRSMRFCMGCGERRRRCSPSPARSCLVELMSEPADPPAHVAFQVFLDGIGAAVRSVFFYVLIGNYVGLGALAREVGFSFWWMALSTVLIWAAPAQVIL